MVDGKEVECTPAEEQLFRNFWALNDEYPEYTGHLMFDGATEPKHDMEQCAKHHKTNHDTTVDAKINELNKLIEIQQEEGRDFSDLLQQRKEMRALKDMDFNHCKTVEELRVSIPNQLKDMWKK